MIDKDSILKILETTDDGEFSEKIDKLRSYLLVEKLKLSNTDMELVINRLHTLNMSKLIDLTWLLGVLLPTENFDSCCLIFGFLLQHSDYSVRYAVVEAIRENSF